MEPRSTRPDFGRRELVVSLHYAVDRTLREISAEFEMSYATVRRDHEDALDALRDECSRAGVEPTR
jgi:DNA-directed RNA polymerase specialized sigma subunit